MWKSITLLIQCFREFGWRRKVSTSGLQGFIYLSGRWVNGVNSIGDYLRYPLFQQSAPIAKLQIALCCLFVAP